MDSITHLRQNAKEHLSEYRYRHTLGCERAAVRLAERYGENPTWCAWRRCCTTGPKKKR